MVYAPVVSNEDATLRVRAMVGMQSIALGFNFLGNAQARQQFLGFAIKRTDLTAGTPGEWLTGQIGFRGRSGAVGQDIPTNEAPLQVMRWSDYTVEPGCRYRYAVHPVFLPVIPLGVGNPVVLDVETAANDGSSVNLHFNRAVAGSRAYRQLFGNVHPKKWADGRAYRWLSRGLEEALHAFIGGAVAGDELLVAIFELEHPGVLAALAKAQQNNVRVRIVYHGRPNEVQTQENEHAIASLALPVGDNIARRQVPKLSHNKFIVHRRGGAALRVWTGSTNLTENGLFFQTNVGLSLPEPTLAAAYADYFDLLCQDLGGADMRRKVAALLDRVRLTLPANPKLFLSPVRGRELLDVAVDLVANAQEAILISCPFGLDQRITDALNANQGRVLEYGLVNQTNQGRLLGAIDRGVNTWYTSPWWLRRYRARDWDAYYYGDHKIHVKSIVADPWGQNPRVLIGSANFSDESVNGNDENALLIEGDQRVAAVAATEFLRVFDHYKFRNYLKRVKAEEAAETERYLVEDGTWTADFYNQAKGKFREREVFAGP